MDEELAGRLNIIDKKLQSIADQFFTVGVILPYIDKELKVIKIELEKIKNEAV